MITIRDDSDWTALSGVVSPDLAADPRLATRAGRVDAREIIEAAVSRWLSSPPFWTLIVLIASILGLLPDLL